ncbi:hypothetical protein QBC35DRAFT_207548 [Podospora australis]|uniref:Uncharacterized protein n=1 Tax=Podospora australis TaxID=1536484 RepID=A0AAN6WIN7_9PEZI|nr:hypothetical protein QBC35DRAFT_207548 [Podospora australis]
MKYEFALMAGVAVAFTPPSPQPPSQTGCPTVTATRELCATCTIPACLVISTLIQNCLCPTPIPTVYLDFPCVDGGCNGAGCSTSYQILTQEIGCLSTSTYPPGPSSTGSGTPSSATTYSPGPSSTGKPSGDTTATWVTTQTTTECTTDEPEPTYTDTVTSTEDCTTDEPEPTYTDTVTSTTDCSTDEPEESTSTTLITVTSTKPCPGCQHTSSFEPDDDTTTTLPPHTLSNPPVSSVTPAPNGTFHSTTRLPWTTSLSSSVVQGGVGRMRPFFGLGFWF